MFDRKSIKLIFDRYKRKAQWDPLISLPVYDQDGRIIAWMRPVTEDYRLSTPWLPDLLGKWRIANPTISTATFRVTKERTLKWLDNLIIGRDDKLLFILHGLDGEPLGHLGYSNFNFDRQSGEVDSILRAVAATQPGLMHFAMIALMRWGFVELDLQEIELSVFADNARAIRFYQRLGFVLTSLKPLQKVVLPDEEKWELAPEGFDGPVEKEYAYMRFDRKTAPVNVRP